MTRAEEIVKAAIKHASEVEEAYRYAYRDGFLDGAKWADKNLNMSLLWHDITEEPLVDNTIVYFTKNHTIGTLKRVDKNRFTWYIEKYAICKWAYLEDLIPKE